MDTWEERMAERAAIRHGLTEAEEFANRPPFTPGEQRCDWCRQPLDGDNGIVLFYGGGVSYSGHFGCAPGVVTYTTDPVTGRLVRLDPPGYSSGTPSGGG